MTEPIKVLHIVPSLAKGGAERMVVDICNSLNNTKDFRAEITLFNNVNEFPEQTYNTPVHYCDITFKPSLIYKENVNLENFKKIVSAIKPHIIHTHLFESEFITHYQSIEGVKFVSHFHDNKKFYDKFSWKTPFVKILLANYILKSKLLLRYKKSNNHFITISEESFRFYHKRLGENNQRIIKLPNAIDLDIFTLKPFQTFTKPLKLISIGSLIPLKAHEFLIYVTEFLNQEGIPTTLEILGYGICKNDLLLLIEKTKLNQKVFLRGKVDKPEVYLRNSDIYIHSSTSETNPRVIMEAMACGLPCVAINVKGVNELIENGKTGFLINERSIRDFAEKIISLYRNPDLHKMMYDNLIEERKKFDINNYIQKLCAFYLRIINKRK